MAPFAGAGPAALVPEEQQESGAETTMFLTPSGFCVPDTWCAPRVLLCLRPRWCSPVGGSCSAHTGTRPGAAGAPKLLSPPGHPEPARRRQQERCNTKQGGQVP